MKKFLILIALFLVFSPAYSMEINLFKLGEQQKYINEIGFRILNSNKIDKRVIFYYYPEKKEVSFSSKNATRKVVIPQGVMAYIDSDDEMATLLAHEIAKNVESYNGLFKGYFYGLRYTFTPRKYETMADKKSIDYLVQAGYNPVASIVLFSKMLGETRYEYYLDNPVTSKRMMTIYEYIYRKYPAYLANNKYIDNIYYQNFLLTSQKEREKFKNQIQQNSTRI